MHGSGHWRVAYGLCFSLSWNIWLLAPGWTGLTQWQIWIQNLSYGALLYFSGFCLICYIFAFETFSFSSLMVFHSESLWKSVKCLNLKPTERCKGSLSVKVVFGFVGVLGVSLQKHSTHIWMFVAFSYGNLYVFLDW